MGLYTGRHGLYTGRHGLYTGRRGLYAGPKYRSSAFELTLPGLLAWWSPRDASTVTLVGSPADDVSQIDDKSGNGEHLVQTVSRNQLQYPTTMTGAPGVNVMDSAESRQCVVSSTLALGASQTIACVIQPLELRNFGFIGNGGNNNLDLGFQCGCRADGTFLFKTTNGTTITNINKVDDPTLTYIVGEKLICQMTYDGVNMTIRVNSHVVTKAATEDPSRTGNFAYGREFANGAFNFVGKMGDCLICDALSTEQQAALEAHWAGIYGVTLP